ncbi:protein glass [Trichonephila clavipes]|nr:protein glass [Trichonephila clavipes]
MIVIVFFQLSNISLEPSVCSPLSPSHSVTPQNVPGSSVSYSGYPPIQVSGTGNVGGGGGVFYSGDFSASPASVQSHGPVFPAAMSVNLSMNMTMGVPNFGDHFVGTASSSLPANHVQWTASHVPSASYATNGTSPMVSNYGQPVQAGIAFFKYKNNNCRTVFFGSVKKAPTKNYAAKAKSNLSQRSNSARAIKVARFNETFPQAELRRLEQRSQARPRRHAEYLASQRAAETPEQSRARRLQHATYMASQRDTETIEAAESRKRAVAERAQQRRLIFTKNTWGYSIKLHSSMTKLLITKATSL